MTNDEILARVAPALEPFGITNVTVRTLPNSDLITILITEADDIDVAHMIADDILKPGPVYFDLSAVAAGKEFRFENWPHVGGSCFMGYLSTPYQRARRRLENARARADIANSLGHTIEADGILDVAYVDFEAAIENIPQEDRR